jgi:hypothetical protein
VFVGAVEKRGMALAEPLLKLATTFGTHAAMRAFPQPRVSNVGRLGSVDHAISSG